MYMLAGLFHCFSQKIVHTNLFCEKRVIRSCFNSIFTEVIA